MRGHTTSSSISSMKSDSRSPIQSTVAPSLKLYLMIGDRLFGLSPSTAALSSPLYESLSVLGHRMLITKPFHSCLAINDGNNDIARICGWLCIPFRVTLPPAWFLSPLRYISSTSVGMLHWPVV